MPATSRFFEKALVLSALALAPCLGFGQQIFTYSATDYQAQSLIAPQPLSLAVRTTFVILGSSSEMQRITGITKDAAALLRPPTGWTSLVRATLDGKLVETFIKGSNADGEMIGSVKLPPEFRPEDVVLKWQLQDGSVCETKAVSK